MRSMLDDQKTVTRQALAYVAEVTREEAESNIRYGYSTLDKSNEGDRDNSLGRSAEEINVTHHERHASAERIATITP